MPEAVATQPPSADFQRRQDYLARWGQLDNEYAQGWRSTQEQIVRFLQPGRGRFQTSEANQGQRKDESIVNDTGIDAAKKLVAALDTGINSPVREWFHLATVDPELSESAGVREYCHEWEGLLFQLIARSNAYRVFPQVYHDAVGPATAIAFIDPDEETLFRLTHFPVGSYRLEVDEKGAVSGIFRQFTMTASQMARRFGLENCSEAVKQSMGATPPRPNDRFVVMHVVEKRRERLAGKRDAKNKPWASEWLEIGQSATGTSRQSQGSNEPKGFLKVSGYEEQPFIALRWSTTGEDAYGRGSPGWQSLGDTKALQALEMTSGKNVARIGDPPMNAPSDLANGSLVPGAINPMPKGSTAKFEPSVVIPPAAIEVVEHKLRQHEGRIQRAHYADLLLMISQDERAQPVTAEEIRAKKDERLLQLGGVFARIADEMLKPFINRIFAMAQRAGLGPPPPPELQQAAARGVPLKIEFENVLVTAQKTVGITAVKQLVDFANTLALKKPEVLQKLDGDEVLDTVADMLGVKPNLLHSDEELKQIRDEANRQAQAAAMGEAMTKGATAIKDASQADPENLRQLLEPLSPYAAAGTGAVR